MKYRLEDLVDIPRLQELTDHLYEAAGIPSSIVTMEGEILTGSGWQRICTDFHRKNQDIEKECIASDIAIRKKMDDGEPFCMYTCPRGLTDGSVPIVIEGEHLANAFAGQLFLEEPGEETEQLFRDQARHFGMDEEAYVKAFREVPVIPVKRFRAALSFLAKLAHQIANQGLGRKRELEAQERLRQNESKYRTLFENMAQGVFYQRADGSLVDCNPALLELFGLTHDEFFGRTSIHPEWRVLDEDGSPIPGDQHPSMQALRTGEPVRDIVLNVFNPRRQQYVWLMVNASPQFQPGEDKPYQVFVTLHDITEQKRVEARLRKTTTLLQETERTARIGGWEFDPQTLTQTWTDETFRILEIDAEDGEPQVPEGLNFIAPAYRAMAEQAVGRALEFGEPYDQQWEVLTAKGNKRWVQAVARVIEADGQILSVRGSFQDITDRKRAEERVKYEREVAQLYLEVAGVMLITLDVDQKVTTINPAGCQILGAREDEIIGHNWFDEFLHTDDIDEVKSVFAKIASGEVGPVEYYENPIIRKDGNKRIIAWHNSIIRDPDGEITGLFSSGEDITERKQAIDDLRESEEKLRAVLDATPFPVAIVDTEVDRVFYWSRSALSIFGHTAKTASGWHEIAYPDPVYREEVLTRWKPFLEVARQTGKPVNTGDYRVTCADGTERECEIWATFIPNRLIVTFNDVSERRKAERELRQFEWLLDKEGTQVEEGSRVYTPAYRNPTQWNTARVILDGVGTEAMAAMARDMLDLMDTCVAVYEANGDYAYGVFDSIWCQTMDNGSFRLCGTDDTQKALACGKWLCHDNCWNESAKAAMETGEPTDIECVGGIRLYGVPIRAGDEVIGAMNIGYSSPPRTDKDLRELSEKYQVDIDTLRGNSMAYKPRPPFIIEVAKRRCHSMAKMIGNTIERQRTKAALLETEAHHRTLVETIPDLIWLKDPNGVYLSCNLAFERFFGSTEKEIQGKTDYDFVDRELADSFRHNDRRAIEANGPVINEEWLTFADDGYRGLFETIKTPMVVKEGHIIGVMGIARDITERNRSQNEIEAIANERSWLLKSMINAFVIFESVFDDSGEFTSYRFKYINEAYEDITGVRLEEVRGKTVHEVWPETEDSWIENYGKVALTGDPMTFNMYHDPTKKLYHSHAYRPWETQDRFCVVFEDISEQKRNEEDKEKLEQQLYHSQKMESIGRLAGGVAHDFNNLLTVITGNIHLAQMDINPGDRLNETLDEVNKAAKRAADLTHQLLAFSRKQIIKPRVINLNDLIKGLRRMLVRILGEDLELQTIPQTQLGLIKADPGQIEQVVTNLGINARDAMPDGGKLTIETADVFLDEDYCKTNPNVQPGDYVMLTVCDNGSGMDAETQKNIFDPFYTTKKEGQGTGLGLAMVYGIVTQHGGSIAVSSEVGEGTTIKVYFPRVQEKEDPLDKKLDDPELPQGTETILVVEDEETVRNIAIRMLTRLGYQIISAEDGPNALAIIEKLTTPIDLLLTDVIMPNMNGRELAERVRLKHPEMKILYTSGYTKDVIGHHGVLDEGLEFLAKPYTPWTLAAKVRKLLDRD
jgi:PAS domain S-box-containing protein